MGVRSALERLKQIGPKSGRIITENGEIANAADFMRTQNAVNDVVNAGLGRVVGSHKRITLPAGGTAYFRQFVPSGTTIRGILGGAGVIDGNVELDLIIGATPGAVTDTLDPHNADRRQINITNPTEDSYIEQLDGFTGGIELDVSLAYSSTPGDSRMTTTSLTGSGIGGIFDSTVQPYFRFRNVGASDCEVIARWVWADITEVLEHVR